MNHLDAKSLIRELFEHTIEDICVLTWDNSPERFKNSYDCLYCASLPLFIFRFESDCNEKTLLDMCFVVSYGGQGGNLHYRVSPNNIEDILKIARDIYKHKYVDYEFHPVCINNFVAPLYGMGSDPICAKTITFTSKNDDDIGFFVEFQNGFHLGIVIGPNDELVTLFNEHADKAIARAEQMPVNEIAVQKYSFPANEDVYKEYLTEINWFSW